MSGFVVIAEDDDDLRAVLAMMVEQMGFRVVEARSCAETLRALSSGLALALVLDWHLPDGDGGAVLQHIAYHRLVAFERIAVISAGTRAILERPPVARVWRKPVELGELTAFLDTLVDFEIERGVG